MPTYKDYLHEILPPCLQGTVGTQFSTGLINHFDDILSETKDAVKTRFPTVAAAAGDDTALARLGDDSRLPRYPIESDDQYGARLQSRWDRHGKAGGNDGATRTCPILDELTGIGFSGLTLMTYNDWPADAGNPYVHHSPGVWYESGGVWGSAVWGVDSWGSPWWSRFWVYIRQYNAANIPEGDVWGVDTWGSGRWGFNLSDNVIASAIAAIRKWKPAHSLFVYLALLTEGTPMDAVWGYGAWGSATWGASGSEPGVSIIYVNQ